MHDGHSHRRGQNRTRGNRVDWEGAGWHGKDAQLDGAPNTHPSAPHTPCHPHPCLESLHVPVQHRRCSAGLSSAHSAASQHRVVAPHPVPAQPPALVPDPRLRSASSSALLPHCVLPLPSAAGCGHQPAASSRGLEHPPGCGTVPAPVAGNLPPSLPACAAAAGAGEQRNVGMQGWDGETWEMLRDVDDGAKG